MEKLLEYFTANRLHPRIFCGRSSFWREIRGKRPAGRGARAVCLDCWVVVGLLVCWTVGLLDCWAVGLLGCSTAGLLVCWAVGLLGCWSAGLLLILPIVALLSGSSNHYSKFQGAMTPQVQSQFCTSKC